MPNPEAETRETLPLETQIMEIFTEASHALREGEAFASSKENSHADALKQAIGQLPVGALAKLIAGRPLEETLAESVKGITVRTGARTGAKLWAKEEQARKLRSVAYSAYCKTKDAEVSELLNGMKITATTRENAGDLGSAICRSNGIFETAGDSPGTVSGTFYLADTNCGNIVLSAEEPTDEIKFWRISLFNSMTSEQRADIEIEAVES